jgi:CRP-like cAMP-binding protein
VLLGRVPALASLPGEALLDLARASTRRSLRRGQVLVREGAHFDALALPLAGRLDVTTTARGRTMVLRALSPSVYGGDALGLSLIAGAKATATIIAGERDTELLLVPGRDVRAALLAHPAAALDALLALARLVATLSDELVEARTLPLEERLLRLLLRVGAGRREVAATQAMLADALGASREHVNKCLARLESRGLVRRGRGRIGLFRV